MTSIFDTTLPHLVRFFAFQNYDLLFLSITSRNRCHQEMFFISLETSIILLFLVPRGRYPTLPLLFQSVIIPFRNFHCAVLVSSTTIFDSVQLVCVLQVHRLLSSSSLLLSSCFPWCHRSSSLVNRTLSMCFLGIDITPRVLSSLRSTLLLPSFVHENVLDIL